MKNLIGLMTEIDLYKSLRSYQTLIIDLTPFKQVHYIWNIKSATVVEIKKERRLSRCRNSSH